jgi:hypothetical protein
MDCVTVQLPQRDPDVLMCHADVGVVQPISARPLPNVPEHPLVQQLHILVREHPWELRFACSQRPLQAANHVGRLELIQLRGSGRR